MLLIDVFLQKYEKIYEIVEQDPIASSGQRALIQGIRQGEKIYFEQSTMTMLIEKLAHYEETIKEIAGHLKRPILQELIALTDTMFHRGTWIWFHKPLKLGDDLVSAMFCFVPSTYIATGKDVFTYYLINPEGDITEVMTSKPGEVWEYEPLMHRCPFCTQRGYGRAMKIEPCTQCAAKLMAWAHIFSMSSIIAAQYLAAVRYEEKTFTGLRQVKRAHSNKNRRVPVNHVFKVIDANEILVLRPPLEETRQGARGEVHGSWVEEAQAEDDLAYKETTTRGFPRRYHTLEGTITHDFPLGVKRKQPVRISRQEKRITKVKASDYE